jgi:hypothetical protein
MRQIQDMKEEQRIDEELRFIRTLKKYDLWLLRVALGMLLVVLVAQLVIYFTGSY